MEEEGSLCQTCFVGTLHLSTGILVCDTCGMTQQSFLEETQEYQGTQRRTAVRAGPSQQKMPVWKQVEEKDKLPVREGIEAYIYAFQDLLQLQVSQMIHLGLVSDHVQCVVKEIWLLHVQRVKILEDSFYDEVESDVQSSNNQVMDTQSPIQFSRTSVVVASHLNRRIPLSLSLSMLFLGCWVSRETVDPYDITRLSTCGNVQYLGFWKRYASSLEPYLKVFSKSYFCPTGVSSPAKIYLEARKLAAFLKLSCPPLNIMAWNHRFLHALNIPEDLLGPLSICQVIYWGQMNSVENYLCHGSKTPWATLAAKSAFYLDVILRCSSGDRSYIDNTIRSSLQDILDAAKLMPNNISSTDIMQMSQGELSHFLKFLKEVYFQFEPFGKLEFILKKLPVEDNGNAIQRKTGRERLQCLFQLENTPEICQKSFQDHSLSILQLSLSHLSWGSMKHTIKVRTLHIITYTAAFLHQVCSHRCARKKHNQ